MKVFKFYDDVYMVNYRLIMGGSIAEADALIQEETGQAPTLEDITDNNAFCECVTNKDGDEFYYIRLSEKYANIRGLAHELFHAVVHLFVKRGISLVSKEGEAGAWYYDFLINKFYPQVVLYAAGS